MRRSYRVDGGSRSYSAALALVAPGGFPCILVSRRLSRGACPPTRSVSLVPSICKPILNVMFGPSLRSGSGSLSPLSFTFSQQNGQVLNKTDIAAPLGVSIPTVSQWLGILEITGQILQVPPFFENFGKRLIKSPKMYFLDSGLLCHLLASTT